jgi:hypothetical protein
MVSVACALDDQIVVPLSVASSRTVRVTVTSAASPGVGDYEVAGEQRAHALALTDRTDRLGIESRAPGRREQRVLVPQLQDLHAALGREDLVAKPVGRHRPKGATGILGGERDQPDGLVRCQGELRRDHDRGAAAATGDEQQEWQSGGEASHGSGSSA